MYIRYHLRGHNVSHTLWISQYYADAYDHNFVFFTMKDNDSDGAAFIPYIWAAVKDLVSLISKVVG